MFDLSTKIKELKIVRFDTDMDLLLELRKYVHEHKIKNAVILNGIGSSKSYSYHVVSSPDLPPKEMYPKEEKPLDIISVQGFILDGRVHAHIIFSDEKISFGGHLEEGVKLLTFAIITLGIIDDDDISGWDKLKL
jgi:predicted DNA-binding protein with PD1-like motif